MTSPVKPTDRSAVIWYAGLAVVVVLLVVALLVTRSSKSDVSDQVRSEQTSEVNVGATGSAGSSTSTTSAGSAGSSTTEADADGGASAAALPTFESSTDDPAVGKTIPTVSGTTLDGKPLTIGPDGTAKVILFVAHWCPHCQREVPELVDHLKGSPMPDDVELLTVSTNVAEERGNYPPKAWLDDAGWTAPVLADSSDSVAAATYGLSSFPYFVVVDAEGKVVFRASGELSMDQFDALVTAAQTGDSPT